LDDRVFVVFNPFSGKGRGASLVQPVLSALGADGGPVEHAFTQKAGDEARLASEAAARGYGKIVAVGGDGTWSNVGNALIRSGSGAALGLIAGGTGCDLAKSLGIPAKDLAACARIVREGRVRRIDAGRVEDKYFLNILGFGFDIAVIEDSWSVRWLQGDLVYLYCALRQLRRFPGFPVEIEVDGAPPTRQELLMLVIANARVFGGGFQIAPEASLDDGRLDAMAFANMGFFRRLGVLSALMKGRHTASSEVTALRAARYRLRFERPPAYETDGEWNQARAAQLTIEAAPGALPVLVPA
jgi:diacylglycerol kinase (ATP)